MSHGKLFMIEASPPVRAVLLTEKALGLSTEKIVVNLMEQAQLKPEYVKLNPQHTVPMYIDADGTKIIDSHAIVAYMVAKYGKTDALYPKDLVKRSLVDHRLHYDSSEVFTTLRGIVKPILMKQATGPNADQIANVENIYSILNAYLLDSEWMAGNSVTIADISLFASLSSLNVIHPIDAKHAKLNVWLKKMNQLPFASVNNAGLEVFKTVVQG